MDAVGSKRALRHLAPQMRARGIEVREALPVGLFRRNAARFDLRNHRKIAVIDGQIGYTGSQNIANADFVPGFPNEELAVRIQGPAAQQLQAVFLADHYAETSEVLDDKAMFPEVEFCGNTILQVVPSGPGYRRASGHELLVTLLYSARERVVLTTPYFVPNEPILEAVCSAARRGVNVRLVVSRHANQLLTQLAQRSYYDELLDAGVRIHLYRPHFLHAKHLTIDNDIAVIGSSNIDIRSFALNAEANAIFYDAAIVDELQQIQQRYFLESDLLTRDAWAKRPLASRVLQGVARLADSLL
jgi:cardiolipin synthase